MTPSTQKQLEKDELDKILDWHHKVIIEATIEAMKTGNRPEVLITSVLIEKHRTNAKAKLNALVHSERQSLLDAVLAAGPEDKHSMLTGEGEDMAYGFNSANAQWKATINQIKEAGRT